MALISVILPVHDAVDYLPTAAASLSAQSHSDFEIIAIDDGSTDGSGQVLERWKAREPRLRTMRRENRGLISTLNEAIGMASGRYLARMDADDFAFASRLGAQFDAFSEDPNLVVCGTNFVTLLPNGRAIPADPDVQTSHRELRIASRFYTSLRHPTVMIDRERAGPEPIYDKAYPHAEDFDLFRRLAEVGNIRQLPVPHLAYRLHAGSVSARRRKQMEETHVRILEESLARHYPDAAGTGFADVFNNGTEDSAARSGEMVRRLVALERSQPQDEQAAYSKAVLTTIYFIYASYTDAGRFDLARRFLEASNSWKFIRRRERPLLAASLQWRWPGAAGFAILKEVDRLAARIRYPRAGKLVPELDNLRSLAPDGQP